MSTFHDDRSSGGSLLYYHVLFCHLDDTVHARDPFVSNIFVTTGRCLDVFTVALHQATEGERWYTSTAQLQLASLEFCKACRSVPTLYMKVDEDAPERLWDHSAAHQHRVSRAWRRLRRVTGVPTFRPRGVTCKLDKEHLCRTKSAFANVECLVLGEECTPSARRRLFMMARIRRWLRLHGHLSSSRSISGRFLSACWTAPDSQPRSRALFSGPSSGNLWTE